MKTKKIKLAILSVMIVFSAFIVQLTGTSSTEFQGGACAALAGAYTGDAAWITVGFAMMEYSSWMSAVPGFQGAAALGFL
jgi:hypothetical protein